MTTLDQSEITLSQGGGACYSGPDAVSAFRGLVLASALEMYAKHRIQATRVCSPTQMLKHAEQITHKKYKRGQYQQAADDVKAWAVELRDSIPTIIKD